MARIYQFFKDVLSPFYCLDQGLLARYLDGRESLIFSRLRKAEQLHAAAVAVKVRDRLPEHLDADERQAIVKAALLHDVGKYYHATGPLAKTALVLAGKRLGRDPVRIKRFSALDVYLNHAQYSWSVVQKLESFPDYPYLYDLIRFHHDPERFTEKYGLREQAIFNIYKKADDES